MQPSAQRDVAIYIEVCEPFTGHGGRRVAPFHTLACTHPTNSPEIFTHYLRMRFLDTQAHLHLPECTMKNWKMLKDNADSRKSTTSDFYLRTMDTY